MKKNEENSVSRGDQVKIKFFTSPTFVRGICQKNVNEEEVEMEEEEEVELFTSPQFVQSE